MKEKQKGMALMIAVWAVIILGAFITGILLTGARNTAYTSNRIAAAQARHLAEAGVYRAIAALADPRERAQLPLGVPAPFAMQLEDKAQIHVVVRDSCGAIDLNWAPEALLRAFSLTQGLPPAVAERLARAIVSRQKASLFPETAELNTGPWQSIDELAVLEGVDAEMLEKLRSGLTVNCREAGADKFYATQAVKEALHLSGAGGVPSHRLAYEIEAAAILSDGAKAAVRAAIWLSLEPGPPYYHVAAWRSF